MIPFLSPNGPDPTLPGRTTNVRIAAGTTVGGNGDDIMMGSVPGVALFDIAGIKIGQSDIDNTNIPTFRDIQIVTPTNLKDTQPEYISLSAGKDAICIAYVTVTTSQNLKYAFVGDIAKACNVPSMLSITHICFCTHSRRLLYSFTAHFAKQWLWTILRMAEWRNS
jgi:hypothetical protein